MLRENLFISICSIFFFFSGCLLVNGTNPDLPVISLVFWSTLLIYSINSSIKINFLNTESYKSLFPPINKKAKIIVLLIGITLVHIPFLNLKTFLFLFHLGLISTLYNVPEKTKSRFHFPLRSIPILKIFLIAYVWASISSFLPAIIANGQVFTSQSVLIFIAHLLFIISITLPFDIRDFQVDHKNDLMTFPHLIGILPTKLLALACLISFTVINYQVADDWYVIVFSLITAVIILIASAKKKTYYFTFVLDGTIILYFITILLSL